MAQNTKTLKFIILLSTTRVQTLNVDLCNRQTDRQLSFIIGSKLPKVVIDLLKTGAEEFWRK